MKFLITFVIIALVTSDAPATTPPKTENSSDSAFARLQELVGKIAENMMKSSDILSKRKKAGSLPEGYNDKAKKDAEATRDNKKEWNRLMNQPTDLFRMCVYPTSKVNYAKWCDNTFAGMKNKLDSIEY